MTRPTAPLRRGFDTLRRGFDTARRARRHAPAGAAPVPAAAETLEERALLTTFTVTTGDDVIARDGVVSLREAVIAANIDRAFSDVAVGGSSTAADTIQFDASLLTDGGGGPGVVNVDRAISVSGRLMIDGSPGSNAGPFVTLDGRDRTRLFVVHGGASLKLLEIDLTRGNSAGRGGAVAVVGGSTLTVEDAGITSSFAERGGGAVAAVGGSRVVFDDAVLAGNSADGAGGAVYVRGGSAVVIDENVTGSQRVDLRGNVTGGADGGGGLLYAVGGADVTLAGVGRFGMALQGNLSQAGGGAVHVVGGTLTIRDVAFAGNATGGSGGAVLAQGAEVTIDGAEFRGNGAVVEGGAVSLVGGTATVAGVDATANGAVLGGAFAVRGGSARFAGVRLMQNTSNLAGGGLALLDDARLSATDLVAVNNGGTRNFRPFVENLRAAELGDGSSLDVPPDAFFVARGIDLSNVRTRTGGGIFNDGDELTVVRGRVAGNLAESEGDDLAFTPGALTTFVDVAFVGDPMGGGNRSGV